METHSIDRVHTAIRGRDSRSSPALEVELANDSASLPGLSRPACDGKKRDLVNLKSSWQRRGSIERSPTSSERSIEEECVVGKEHGVGGCDLYISDRRWSGANNEEVVSRSVFSNDFLRRAFGRRALGRGVLYHDMALSCSASQKSGISDRSMQGNVTRLCN
jgi:hypothetical protein